jgi:hypothetical protein
MTLRRLPAAAVLLIWVAAAAACSSGSHAGAGSVGSIVRSSPALLARLLSDQDVGPAWTSASVPTSLVDADDECFGDLAAGTLAGASGFASRAWTQPSPLPVLIELAAQFPPEQATGAFEVLRARIGGCSAPAETNGQQTRLPFHPETLTSVGDASAGFEAHGSGDPAPHAGVALFRRGEVVGLLLYLDAQAVAPVELYQLATRAVARIDVAGR